MRPNVRPRGAVKPLQTAAFPLASCPGSAASMMPWRDTLTEKSTCTVNQEYRSRHSRSLDTLDRLFTVPIDWEQTYVHVDLRLLRDVLFDHSMAISYRVPFPHSSLQDGICISEVDRHTEDSTMATILRHRSTLPSPTKLRPHLQSSVSSAHADNQMAIIPSLGNSFT